MVDLEVGDEVYAFERFVPMKGEEAGAWFRGSVQQQSEDLVMACKDSALVASEADPDALSLLSLVK
jgi:hypothetical protein